MEIQFCPKTRGTKKYTPTGVKSVHLLVQIHYFKWPWKFFEQWTFSGWSKFSERWSFPARRRFSERWRFSEWWRFFGSGLRRQILLTPRYFSPSCKLLHAPPRPHAGKIHCSSHGSRSCRTTSLPVYRMNRSLHSYLEEKKHTDF